MPPPLTDPPAELLAQAALFLVLRDLPPSSYPGATPWTRLARRRFGGDVHARTVALESETGTTVSVKVFTHPSNALYDIDITVRPATDAASSSAATTSVAGFRDVSATLVGPTALSTTLAGALTRATIIPQSQSHGAERLHIFSGGHTSTVLRRAPAWAEALSADARSVARGALRAPMPSLVVEVRVVVGERVEKDQAIVVLESMKTETVLRASADGIVKAVGCAKGEMVEEGRELVDFEGSEE